jgi:protein-S-isoprenylcysteine O-methyltransferase Ste14
MERDLATAIVATTVSTYWLAVIVMVARSWIRFRGSAGVVPKVRHERWMWLVWVPNTIAWIVLPWWAWDDSRAASEATGLLSIVRYVTAFLALAAFVLTTHCWRTMGSNWSMAINPKKQTALLTRGTFGIVRHPIYALSLLLMLTTIVTVATWPMVLVGCIHILMIVGKTLSEERYLRRLHGRAYDQYCQQTGRYLPFRGLLGHQKQTQN